jgi:hypothetical protein
MYNVSVSRAHSGLNFQMEGLQDVFERINDYDHSFPDEIIEIHIAKIPSLAEHRQKKDADKRDGLKAKIAQAWQLKNKGYSNAAIAKEMGLPVGAVRTLLNSSIEIPEGDTDG